MSTLNTNCIIESKHIHANGCVELTMRMLNSTRPMATTNELPNILHSIVLSGLLQNANTHRGFDYVLDFTLEERPEFPYVLDFTLE